MSVNKKDSRRKSCIDRLSQITEDTDKCTENVNKTLPYEVKDGIAIISLSEGEPEELTSWGTLLENDPLIFAFILTGEGKFFSNGFDLKFMQTWPEQTDDLQKAVEHLCSKIMKSSLLTIAAVNGHATAAGAMLLLSFDYVVMNSSKGFVFVPGIDLGLVYSPGMIELMKAKLPSILWRDFIIMGKRYDAVALLQHGVIYKAVDIDKILSTSIEIAIDMKSKTKYPQTLAQIKSTLYHVAISALDIEVDVLLTEPTFKPMGFEIVQKGKDKAENNDINYRRSKTKEEETHHISLSYSENVSKISASDTESRGVIDPVKNLRLSIVDNEVNVHSDMMSAQTKNKRKKCIIM